MTLCQPSGPLQIAPRWVFTPPPGAHREPGVFTNTVSPRGPSQARCHDVTPGKVRWADI